MEKLMKTIKLLRFFTMIIIVCLVGAGCTKTPATTAPQDTAVAEQPVPTIEQPKPEQVLRVAIGRDTGPLDAGWIGNSHWVALDMVYEGLIVYQEDGSIGPELADSWEVSDDGLVWTFHLHPGVTFHDGTPFNAEAAKWNLDQWVGSEGESWLPASNLISSIEAPDEYTLILRTSKYYYALLYDLSITRPPRMISPNSHDAAGNLINPAGTGPWMLQEHILDQRSVFVRYEDYWRTKPQLEKVIFEVIPDAQTRVSALLSGEVDVIGGDYLGPIGLESIPVLEADPNIHMLSGPGDITYFVQLNYKKAPTDDPLVRKAINVAIDRQIIADTLFQGKVLAASSLFPPVVPYSIGTDPVYYTYDPTRAESLLAEAGWTKGSDGIMQKDGQPLKLSLVVDSTYFPQATSLATVLQDQLSKAGMQVDIRLTDYGGWSDALQNGDYAMATSMTWGAPYDPHSSLTGMFYSGHMNLEGIPYSDDTLDNMIDEVISTQDEGLRQERYTAIWNYLGEQGAVVPIVHTYRLYAISNRVEGFKLAPTEYELDLTDVTIK
jgi:nickel ABC transporter nickel/metallophore binding protein